MDLVFNHTSDQHPWFLESRSSRHSEKRDWYIWREPREGGGPPNNWQSVFGGRAWTWDENTEQYYLHLFLKEQPDLNWRNPEVRQALMEIVQFWLDRGVDGFRLDVFNMWFKDAALRDNPSRLGLRAFDRQHHIHDSDQPEMHAALRAFRAILDSQPGRTSVGELFGRGPEMAASYCGEDQLHMVFNFDYTDCRWDPACVSRSIREWEAALAGEGWPAYVSSSHDISRAVSRYGRRHPDQWAKAGAALLLTQRGTPFLYYGEEIGMPDLKLRRSQILDPPGRRYWPFFKGRDVNRGPMQWEASAHAGFTAGDPWLPVHPGYVKRNVAAQREDPDSVLSFYRALIRLRRSSPALRRGTIRLIPDQARQGLAYLRTHPREELLVAVNFRAKESRVTLEPGTLRSGWRMLLTSNPTSTARLTADAIHLGPLEAAIWRTQSLGGM
jgi:alpha-glucosidase